MTKRILLLVAALAATLTLTTGPALAVVNDGGNLSCDPASQPAPVARVTRLGDQLVTARTWVTHTQSACNHQSGTWSITGQHVHEWKRYGRDVPGGFACQMWARDRHGLGSMKWTRWHKVAWASATSC